jgi:phage shock protein PspC (stress-responsive transcriptional regulator)
MSISEELGQLGTLHERGVLNDDEFARAKARVIGDIGAQPGGPSFARINGLSRARANRWVAGVCGGLAQVTGLAAWVWRLAFTLLVLCGGTGILLYVLLWLFVPAEAPATNGARREAYP